MKRWIIRFGKSCRVYCTDYQFEQFARALRVNTNDLPLAVKPFKSYRYKGRYGWIMIGAMNHADALKEAARSFSDRTEHATLDKLQVWSGDKYEWVGGNS